MEYGIKKRIVDADTKRICDDYSVQMMDAKSFIETLFTIGGISKKESKKTGEKGYCYAIRDIDITDDHIIVQVDRDYRVSGKE